VPAFITAYWLSVGDGADDVEGVVVVGCKEIDGFDGGVDDTNMVKGSQMGAETLSLDPIIAVL